DITPWFDRLVVSHDLAAPKEEQAFWHALQALHPFDPARTLFIDDTESVLESARQYGIAHLLTLLQPDSQLQKRLDTRFP
ncbi:MAG TPA: haloacid dehalogenase, partial [Halieaceae bacterium]|nr:haloacid dehalogenase [Halieaceae bacterium]